jgi:L-cysteine:1D-myo-inositol 2-amino-2-deoxy-alpha-D-glucopyranoside ligase
MNSWPQIFLPPLDDYSFPQLNLLDGNRGLVKASTSQNFSIYVCGITPYDSTHLGHAATYLAFDLINRYQLLAKHQVDFIENVTDIDDPLLERAKRDNQDWQTLAQEQIDLFKSDMSALRIIPPKKLVKVTESFDLIEKFITQLSDRGFLYKIEEDYYFSVGDFLEDLPMTVDQAKVIFQQRGGDPERTGKKHPLDPVVWLANQEGDPGWSSKFGFGRPGWHVECTAIACNHLDNSNSDPIIDLQGGGSDLLFPHHYMSAKIVQAAYGREFSSLYIHAGMIGLDGEKMSKSKGNLVFVSKLLEDGVDPMIIRWALLTGHYQSDRQWSDDLLKKAESEVGLMRTALSRTEVADTDQLLKDLILDLSNNLDTPTALNRLVLWAKKSQKDAAYNQSGQVSRAIDSLLGLAL